MNDELEITQTSNSVTIKSASSTLTLTANDCQLGTDFINGKLENIDGETEVDLARELFDELVRVLRETY